MNRPNLFTYATSELSQDAFLCWILNWADPKYKDNDLHQVGTQFIEAIFNKHQRSMIPIESISIEKQVDGLDILAVLNGDIAILIEDKTYTNDHSNQLERYREAMDKRGYPYNLQLPIYYKIANQSDYKSVEDAGYEVFHRKDMLSLLKNGIDRGITDSILLDYYDHLLQIEISHESYRTRSIDQWESGSWRGFYTKLQEMNIPGEWAYVANPRGGFLGFWWHWKKDANCRQYLQLEQEKLCFKIEVENGNDRKELRDDWCKKVLNDCNKYDLNCKRPNRFGNGRFMTIAVLDEYRVVDKNGIIDMERTVERLKSAENLLDGITEQKK